MYAGVPGTPFGVFFVCAISTENTYSTPNSCKWCAGNTSIFTVYILHIYISELCLIAHFCACYRLITNYYPDLYIYIYMLE